MGSGMMGLTYTVKAATVVFLSFLLELKLHANIHAWVYVLCPLICPLKKWYKISRSSGKWALIHEKKPNTFNNEMYSDREEICIHLGESYYKHREESPESTLTHRQQRLSRESRAITQQGFGSNAHFKRLPHLKERPELSGLSRLVWDAGELT